jgi:hypothetical protein
LMLASQSEPEEEDGLRMLIGIGVIE